jgi:hypothetical protein
MADTAEHLTQISLDRSSPKSGVHLFQPFGSGIQLFQTFGLGNQLFQSFGSAISFSSFCH